MQAGNLVAVQHHTLITLGIQAVTEGSFDHLALAISPTEVIEAVPAGVKISNVSEYTRYAVYECVDIKMPQVVSAVSYLHQHIGEKYSYLQDAGFAINAIRELFKKPPIPNLWAEHGHVVCSALVDLALRSGNFVLREDRQAGDVTPMSCLYTPKVHFIENHNLWEV